MVFYNNTDKAINFSIGDTKYSVASGSEFNLRDSIALVVKKRLLSYGLSLQKSVVQASESGTPVGESSSEPAPSLEEAPKSEEISEETSPVNQEEEAPKKRGRKKKD